MTEPITLICFGHAGALFDPFIRLGTEIGPNIRRVGFVPVRSDYPCLDVETYLSRMCRTHAHLFRGRIVLLGHSAGALLALALATRLHSRCDIAAIGLSSCTPPSRRTGQVPASTADPNALLEFIVRLGGTRQEILDHPETRDLCLHAMRHDLALMETHDAALEAARLRSHVIEFWGQDEDRLKDAPYWKNLGTSHEMVAMKGGHFAIYDHLPLVKTKILDRLNCMETADHDED